jgi:hypothetical protein
MNAENDYSVREPGAPREVWGVVPVSDQSANGGAREKNKRRLRKRKGRAKKPDAETPAEEPDLQGRPEEGPEDADGRHSVDHLA